MQQYEQQYSQQQEQEPQQQPAKASVAQLWLVVLLVPLHLLGFSWMSRQPSKQLSRWVPGKDWQGQGTLTINPQAT